MRAVTCAEAGTSISDGTGGLPAVQAAVAMTSMPGWRFPGVPERRSARVIPCPRSPQGEGPALPFRMTSS
jgi:hypothetical protein